MPNDYVPSRGLVLQYSETVDTTTVGTAPNRYKEPVTPGEGTFVTLACIKDVPNFANETVEMQEHRCLDDGEKFVAKYPTGFMTGEDTTLRMAFNKTAYLAAQAFSRTGKELCFRLAYAKSPTETVGTNHVRNGHIMSVSDAVNSDGTEVEANLTLSWSTLAKTTAGS